MPNTIFSSIGGPNWGHGAGGVSFSPFSLTLNGGSASRDGDSTATVNSFWTGYTSPLLTNKGIETYQGYYATTLAVNCTCQITAGGAAGWGNTNGRSISATFTLTAGTRLVFFAGKATTNVGASQGQGAAGGASCVMTYSSGVFTPLVVAAGGSSSFNSRVSDFCARPLSETTSLSVAAIRNGYQSGSGLTNGSGGVGRGFAGSAQSGGAGWSSRALITNGSYDANVPDSLQTGARGGAGLNSGADGGFGGGGGDYNNNSYGAGGGGYHGGWETPASSPAYTGDYQFYHPSWSNQTSNATGPMSYVNPSGSSSVVDNGFHGSTASSTTVANQTQGTVTLTFS